VKVAHDVRKWIAAATAYTVTGAAASGAVGALLGWAGERLGRWPAAGMAAWGGAALAALLAARELGWLPFPLPQRRRQAEKIWYQQFGAVTAAALWGLHIGVGFHTRVRFSGFWLLAVLAVLGRDPLAGAALLVSYWLGRALSLWAAPRLLSLSGAGVEYLQAVESSARAQRRTHALALAVAAVALGCATVR
jgi:hypothetical protein